MFRKCVAVAGLALILAGGGARGQATASREERDAKLAGEMEAVVAEGKADEIVRVFYDELWGAFGGQEEKRLDLARQYVNAKNPLVRFLAEYVMAETLEARKDPEAPMHYRRMMNDEAAAREALVREKSMRADVTETFYQHWYECCRNAGDAKAAREVLLGACRRFLKEGLWGSTVADMYHRVAMEEMGDKDPKLVLEICTAYLENRRKFPGMGVGEVEWVNQLSERQMVLRKMTAGEKVPDFGAMELIKGTEGADKTRRPSMAAAGGSLWLVWRSRQAEGPALRVNPTMAEAEPIRGLPTQMAVAALGDWVYFGGNDGIYRVDLDGAVVRHLTKEDGLPTNRISDLCAGKDRLYFTYFVDSTHYGVAELDPKQGKVTTLAPSGPEAGHGEPLREPYRLWWDGARGQLIATNDGITGNAPPRGYALAEGKWSGSRTWLALTRGTETLTLEAVAPDRGGGRGGAGAAPDAPEVRLRLTGSKEAVVTLAELRKMPEAAWDAKSVWLPLNTGLWRISRATGEITWVAHQDRTACLVAVEAKGYVYVATTRGLYRYRVPG
jgi:hypothetical protein